MVASLTPSWRAQAVRAAESVGGNLEAFHYAFGGTDVFIIADLPDNVSAAALNLATSASGAILGETVVLLAPRRARRGDRSSPTDPRWAGSVLPVSTGGGPP